MHVYRKEGRKEERIFEMGRLGNVIYLLLVRLQLYTLSSITFPPLYEEREKGPFSFFFLKKKALVRLTPVEKAAASVIPLPPSSR